MKIRMKQTAHFVFSLISAFTLSACGPSEKQKSEWAEKNRIECLDSTCEGDMWPKHDPRKESVLKLNGKWFIGPKEYFSSVNSSAVFYWPSKTPGYRGGKYPERGRSFEKIAIEIFLRSNNIPSKPYGYKLIELAQEKDWIADKKILRPGLEAITMKHVIGPHQQYIDHVTYYVATELKGTDGLPPVAGCDQSSNLGGGGTGFMWQPGIWAGTRMHQKHCSDWPEIFQEITRVLQKLRKA